jgi:CRISPR type I-E-associated protein CasB/Cse2
MTDVQQPSATPSPDTGQPETSWLVELGSMLHRISIDSSALSACRRGLGKKPMDVPGMWPYVVPVQDVVEDYDRRRVENAVHHALALYATHQQSRRELNAPSLHQRRSAGQRLGLGEACRRLARRDTTQQDLDAGVRRRFHAAATSVSVDELVGHLRGLVTLLRGAGIPMDYQQLAEDIANWQIPENRARVRRQWGRDFHHVYPPATGPASSES